MCLASVLQGRISVMKFLVHNNDHEEPVSYLKLTENAEGSVTLKMVDECGKSISDGAILTITKEGALSLHRNLNQEMGLKLGMNGRIVLD